jgi:hypothetical protein
VTCTLVPQMRVSLWCVFPDAANSSCAQRLIESMDAAGVDVLVYPTWANVARLVGDYSSPDGAHCAVACHKLAPFW